MTDDPNRSRITTDPARDTPVETLASQALALLASRRDGPPTLSQSYIDKLHAAALSVDPDDFTTCVRALKRGGLCDDSLIDLYIPEAARALGADWCADEIGFAATTIGTARLQSLLRDISPKEPASSVATSTVAVVVLDCEHHTLGALIVAAQLRRIGVSVRLILGRSAEDSAKKAAATGYDAVFLSASNDRTLGKIRTFVEKARQFRSGMSVVLGGPMLSSIEDAADQTGVDIATNDLFEALKACALRTSIPATGARPTRQVDAVTR